MVEKNINSCILWNRKADNLGSWYLKYYHVYSNDNPGVTLTYFQQGQFFPLYVHEKVVDFETFVVYDFKGGRCSVIELHIEAPWDGGGSVYNYF